MPRFKRSMAVFAAVAATAFVAVAPAGAQDIELDGNFSNPCVSDPTIPGCVDYTFNTIDWTMRDNVFGRGLPSAARNQHLWERQAPMLEEPPKRPAPEQIAGSAAVALSSAPTGNW